MTREKNVIIIGGVAGGASCAARLRRLDEHAKITILEMGPDPSFANCGIPYFIGGEIKNRSALNVQTPASLKTRLNLDVKVLTQVTGIDLGAKTITTKSLAAGDDNGKTDVLPYSHLILSTGAKSFIPPIPGIDRKGNFVLRNLQDMDQVYDWVMKSDEATQKCKRAVVAGGGFIGIEMAEQLRHRGLEVTLVEAMPQLMMPLDEEMAALCQTEMENKGVKVMCNAPVAAFEEPVAGADCVTEVVTKDGQRLPADVVILGLGVRPDSALAKVAGIKLNSRGGIIVDEHMKTSDPNVWAVGDAVEVKNPLTGGPTMVPLAGPANRQGRMVADNVCGLNRSYRGTYGTSVVRAFDVTAACTGMNERMAIQEKKKYYAAHIHPNNHAGYYPGAASIHFKIIFEQDTGNVLGAQAVGAGDGVEKRIDVIATALYAGLTVDDLAQLELSYAPPVGTAKDVVNFAGMVGQDIMDGLVLTVQWKDVAALGSDPDVFILDVRGVGEIKTHGAIHPKAYNIPVDNLRDRLAEVPIDKHIVCSCRSGQRSYYACRILMQSGYKRVSNLSGAHLTYSAIIH